MPLPPHELRARYLLSMRISYHHITIWRSLRTTLRCLETLHDDFDIKVAHLGRRIHHYWVQDQVMQLLNQLLKLLNRLTTECKDVMSTLADGRFPSRPISTRLLKKIGWFLAYQKFFRKVIYDLVTQESMLSLRCMRPMPLETSKNRRSSSGSSGVIEFGTSLYQRWGIESLMLRWLRRVERAIAEDLGLLRQDYNSGNMFKAFGEHVFSENEEERAMYRQHGVPWKYEHYNFKMKVGDIEGELMEIPRCEEDEDLMLFVHS